MVRHRVSRNWYSFICSTVLAAFEAYGSSLVGITPCELSAPQLRETASANFQQVHRS